MIFKNSQRDWNLDLPPNRKQVILKMSGGADSAIMAYLFSLYKKEERPDLKLYVATCNGFPPKNWNSSKVKIILKKITELTGVTFEKHYTRDVTKPGWDDITMPELEFEKATPYINTQQELVTDIKKEIQIDNKPENRPIHYGGVTKNPPRSETQFYDDTNKDWKIGRWIFDRDADTVRDEDVTKINEHYCLPFTNMDKKALNEYYVNYNVLEDLFPLTRSCEDPETAQQMINGLTDNKHCGKCWWCLEREWAFGRLL